MNFSLLCAKGQWRWYAHQELFSWADGRDVAQLLHDDDIYAVLGAACRRAELQRAVNVFYNFNGFHAWAGVVVGLEWTLNGPVWNKIVYLGPVNCCTYPSGGFNFFNTMVFPNLVAGQYIGYICLLPFCSATNHHCRRAQCCNSFRIQGRNGDSDRRLFGTFTVRSRVANDLVVSVTTFVDTEVFPTLAPTPRTSTPNSNSDFCVSVSCAKTNSLWLHLFLFTFLEPTPVPTPSPTPRKLESRN
jgi:hypothetical protein